MTIKQIKKNNPDWIYIKTIIKYDGKYACFKDFSITNDDEYIEILIN